MDPAAGSRVLGDDKGPVGLGFDDGVADVGEIGEVLPVDLAVAAGGLGAAFNNVAGDGTGGEFVPIGFGPMELVNQRAEGEGGVRGAPVASALASGKAPV